MAADDHRQRPRVGVDARPRVIEAEQRPPTTPSLAAWWLVVALGAIGLVVLVVGQLRAAVVTFAVTLFVAAALRLVLPEEHAGGLVVRARTVDVLVLAGLATSILVVGLALRRT